MGTTATENQNSSIVRNAEVIDVSVSDVPFAQHRVLYVGGTGDIEVKMQGKGDNVIFRNVGVGFFPVAVMTVYTANTSATNLVSIY